MENFIFVLISVILLLTNNSTNTKNLNDFSTETRAVCEEIKTSHCHYICHDEVFLYTEGKEVSIQKLEGYACHDKDWIDPRVKIV